jgi:uncharacterized protein (TIGR03118 family)
MDTDIRISTKVAIAAAALVGLLACGGGGGGSSTPPPVTTPPPTFQVHAYVSSQATGATYQDGNLVNAWGIAYGPATKFWVANQGTGTSTVYDGMGAAPVPLVMATIPSVSATPPKGPTGVVFNGTTDFAADKFIFATLDGTLSGWSTGTAAVLRADKSGSGASYTGLAIGAVGTTNYLYAANFKGGTIDVFDGTYASASLGAAAFQDATIPAGYAPFNVQTLGSKVYVTYAQRGSDGRSVAGAGLGYVDAFNQDGTLVGRLVSQGLLNAPWGLTIAPAGFGTFGGALLVGNFGDGTISAFDAATGASKGQLAVNGTPIAIPGLWGIVFGNGANAGFANQLYYAAGPAGETQGQFGTVSYGAPGGGTPGGGGGGGGYGY